MRGGVRGEDVVRVERWRGESWGERWSGIGVGKGVLRGGI